MRHVVAGRFTAHLGVEGYNYPGLTVVDTSTWKVLRNIGLTAGAAQVFEWTPDGAHLAVGVLYTGTIELFDESLHMVRRIDLGPGGDVFDLAFCPNGKLLAAARVGGQVSVIDTTTWKQVQAPIRVHSELGDRCRMVAGQQHGGDSRIRRGRVDVRHAW